MCSSDLKNIHWPIQDIISGISLLVLFKLVEYLKLFYYRPWIAIPFYFFLWILIFAVLIIFSLYVCKKRGFWPLFHYISTSKFFSELFKSFFIAFFILLAVSLIYLLFNYIFPENIRIFERQQWLEYVPNSFFAIIVLIMSFTLGPIAEELYFRGFLYNAFKSRLSVPFAIILQALLFAIIHNYNFLTSIMIFLYGISFAIIYEKRINLLSPIFVHVIINAIRTIPLLILTLQNFYVPATNWQEAKTPPDWLKIIPFEKIEKQANGLQQWQYAIDTWGSKGSKQWKIEANAFNAVCYWFPEDRLSCAKAKLGIVTIYYHYLADYRRAIIEADKLLKQYPEHREQCALALVKKGFSYFMLKDFKNSRLSFNRVINEFKKYKKARESAKKGIKWLDSLEKKNVL